MATKVHISNTFSEVLLTTSIFETFITRLLKKSFLIEWFNIFPSLSKLVVIRKLGNKLSKALA